MRGICVVVAAACLLACSSEDTTANHPTDAGVDATVEAGADATIDVTVDAPGEADTDGPSECNSLTNVGAVVQQMYVATDAVTGTGGTIAAGTYVLTAAAVYVGANGNSGPTGLTLQDTLAIDGSGAYERVLSAIDDAGADGTPVHQNGSFIVNGSSIQVTQTCPPGWQPFTSYDSDGTKVKIYAPAGGGFPPVMFEYTKQ